MSCEAVISEPRLDVPRRVDEAMREFLAGKAGFWLESGMRPVYSALCEFVLSPGKRLRPTFCYWGWRGAGGKDGQPIVEVSASLELFHCFCLIHDDVMDVSDTRRGQPSLHRRLADVHARSGWRGEPMRFGTNAAIVTGDVLMMWSDEMYHASGLESGLLDAAYPYLAAMRAEVCLGQFLDADEQAHGGTLAGAVQVVRYKTAGYTVQRPLQIGGALAGADAELLAGYERLGLLLGEAFQFRDDLLGAFGDPKVTGKSNLDDFREGKPTALMAISRTRADRRQARQIAALNGNPRITPEGAAALRGILTSTGAREAVEDLIAERVREAHDVLRVLPLADPEARDALDRMVTSTANRES